MKAEPSREWDVAIVGGGPAGLAAAAELRRLGVGSVLVIDREKEAGGIPRHCGESPFGMREFRRVLRGPAYARRLAEAAVAAGATIHAGVTVTALRPGPRLEVASSEGLGQVSAGRVLLATGVRERSRAARMIGGAKPGGVISTGTLQGLVHLQGLRPFHRPAVLGTELVSFSALLTCRQIGIRPAAMIGPEPRAVARWPAALLPRTMGVPLLLETHLEEVLGESWVTGVVVRDRAGVRRIPADGLIVTGQFQPEASLLRSSHLKLDASSGGPVIDQFGRCSDPAFFAAGNLLRPVETAGWSWNEGRFAAYAISRSLGGQLPSSAGSLVFARPVEPLKYALPQVIAAHEHDATRGHRAFQLRVTRPIRGRLALHVNGAEVWSRHLTALPERRLLVPLSVVPPGAVGEAAFVLTEAS
jgi:thioredoxin reductase